MRRSTWHHPVESEVGQVAPIAIRQIGHCRQSIGSRNARPQGFASDQVGWQQDQDFRIEFGHVAQVRHLQRWRQDILLAERPASGFVKLDIPGAGRDVFSSGSGGFGDFVSN